MAKGTIDDRFFVPLNYSFQHGTFNAGVIRELIRSRGLPEYVRHSEKRDFLGFVLEACVDAVLLKFLESGRISESRYVRGYLSGDESILYETNNWGNISFWRCESGEPITEIDRLCEYHDGVSVIPVVFEVTFTKGRHRNTGLKVRLVEELYGTTPYYCKVRVQKEGERRGISKMKLQYRRRVYNHRKIIVPDNAEYYELAEMLRKEYGPAGTFSKGFRESPVL